MTTAFPALERDGWAGKKLGRFEVMAKLGVGGMSEVFLAWQKAVGGFQRPVVLKRILEAVKRNEEFLRMFVKEAKITSALSHGGIAHLYELVHEEGELFMVMEFVAGATLVEVARACHFAKEPIPIGFTTSVVRDTAFALQYAHTFVDATGRARPVIHRDVAEKNIMVALDGTVKLLDFGIARQTDQPGLTQVGTVKGTAGYMSPEQVRGEKLDARTDVFSLGVVLHECLTGQRLFRRNTVGEEVQALLEGPIAPPSQKNREVPVELDAVVMKALSREKRERYGTAKEMAAAIEVAAGDLLWDQPLRAEFIQRHFEIRQRDITSLLGDPSSTDLGDLLPEDSRRVTRDEFKTVTTRPPITDERTLEVRTLSARAAPDVKTLPVREGRTATVGLPRLTGDVRKGTRVEDDGDEPETVLGLPSDEKKNERRTMPDRVPIDDPGPSASLDEPQTMVTGEHPDGSQGETEEAVSNPGLQPGRNRLRNLAAQKQALLMWIAIGSGLVLGVVLAAFLIFG